MQYFIDSAKIDEIRYAYKNYRIDGITTNPRHIQASGKPFYNVIKEIAKEFENVNMPISVEINPHLDKAEDMVAMGRKIATISDNFVIKIPCTEQGLIASATLSDEDIRTNVTLVFTPSQAIQAARTGAFYVSPFVGWKESNGEDAFEYIKKITQIYKEYSFETEIIVAAVRTGKQISDYASIGADIVTCSLAVYKDSFYSPYTDYGMKIFQDSWDATEEGTM